MDRGGATGLSAASDAPSGLLIAGVPFDLKVLGGNLTDDDRIRVVEADPAPATLGRAARRKGRKK